MRNPILIIIFVTIKGYVTANQCRTTRLLEEGSFDGSKAVEINLRQIHLVSSVAVWGSLGTFLTQYKYSEAEIDWRYYLDFHGRKKVFRMTRNYEETTVLLFLVQYLRLIPLHLGSSEPNIRYQINGCDFEEPVFGFTGRSLINVAGLLPSYESNVTIVFRTSEPNGVLLSSIGSEHDLLLIQLINGRVEVWFDLGSRSPILMVADVSINDRFWHTLHWSHSLQGFGVISRLIIDRVIYNQTTFYGLSKTKLDLNTQIRLGGAMMKQAIIELATVANFTGCLAHVQINARSLLDGEMKSCSAVKNYAACFDYLLKQEIVSLESPDSWLEKSNLPTSYGQPVRVSFDMKTFAENGVLITVPLQRIGSKIELILSDGLLRLNLQGWKIPTELFNKATRTFSLSDMHWHHISLFGNSTSVQLVVDDQSPLLIESSSLAGMGSSVGRVKFGGDGFVGCVRRLRWDSSIRGFFSSDKHYGQISWNTCSIPDRCHPNPCFYGGRCEQSLYDFSCTCQTGYTGRLCRTITWPHSCEEHFAFGGLSGQILIDIDGSGPISPFVVLCNYTNLSNANIQTWLSHDQSEPVEVRGFSTRGSFSQELSYGLDYKNMEKYVTSYDKCWQNVRFQCFGGTSLLINGHMYSYWIDRAKHFVYSWGDAEAGTHMCSCGIRDKCIDKNGFCNCDGSQDSEDFGDINDSERLPVTGFLVGDTDHGTKRAVVTVGPLGCQHSVRPVLTSIDFVSGTATYRFFIVSYDPVTFIDRDGYLKVEQECDLSNGLDIYFEFRTAQKDGVLFYNKGERDDWLKLFLKDGRQIVAQISSSGHFFETKLLWRESLVDNEWHSVYFELTDMDAVIGIDNKWNNIHSQPKIDIPLPLLSHSWKIGGSNEKSAGFVGGVRSVYINGHLKKLNNIVDQGESFAVTKGLSGRCEQSKCKNGGICIEMYNKYECDCSTTPFSGPFCDYDVGIGFESEAYFQYTLHPLAIHSEGNIRIGFETKETDAQLLFGEGLFSDAFFNLSISDNGHLVLTVSDGNEEYRLIDDRRKFDDSTFYDIGIYRFSKDAILVQVNYYDALHLSVWDTSFLEQLNHWTIGSNSFSGCISRLRLGKSIPLKEGFDSKRIKITDKHGLLRPARCPTSPEPSDTPWIQSLTSGKLENIVHMYESNPSIVIERVRKKSLMELWIPVVIIVILLLVLPIVCCLWRCFRNRPAGTYKTHEGDQLYLTPDHSQAALVRQFSPRRRREFYI